MWVRYQITFLKIYSPLRPRIFNTLFIPYNSVICRLSENTVGKPPGPRYEPGTGDLVAGTLTTRLPHLQITNVLFQCVPFVP